MRYKGTQLLLKLARYGVNYGAGPAVLSERLTVFAFPHKVTRTNAVRLIEEIQAQGTFGLAFRTGKHPMLRIRPTRRIT